MESHLIIILSKILKSLKQEDANLAYEANQDLLKVETYERYIFLKGFKTASNKLIADWSMLLRSTGHHDCVKCMVVLLDEVYLIRENDDISYQFYQAAVAGNNIEFATNEIKKIVEGI